MARTRAGNRTGGARVTLQTIADRLGVSRTTVSNAYGRPDQLTPELRQRILEAARELGYAGPHPAARSLRRGRSGSIGVLFTESLPYAVTDPAALLFLQGLAEATGDAGISLLLLPTAPGKGTDPLAARDASVDGFLVYSVSRDDARLPEILARRLPTVIVDQPEQDEAALVGIEDRAAARACAEHLIGLGHRRVAVIALPFVDDDYSGVADEARLTGARFPVSLARMEGYAEPLAAAGIDRGSLPVYECALNLPDSGFAAANALLDRQPRPTAILAMSDQLALGALRAARERGLRVPADLSIVGFDGSPAAAASQPTLTTARQPLWQKGRLAGELILSHEAWTDDRPPRIILPVELAIGASSGPAPT